MVEVDVDDLEVHALSCRTMRQRWLKGSVVPEYRVIEAEFPLFAVPRSANARFAPRKNQVLGRYKAGLWSALLVTRATTQCARNARCGSKVPSAHRSSIPS